LSVESIGGGVSENRLSDEVLVPVNMALHAHCFALVEVPVPKSLANACVIPIHFNSFKLSRAGMKKRAQASLPVAQLPVR
jgi:hypothetical protein